MKAAALLLGLLALASVATAADVKRRGASRRMLEEVAAAASAAVTPQAVSDAQGAAGTAEAQQWGGGSWQDWRYQRPGWGGAWRPPGDSAWGWPGEPGWGGWARVEGETAAPGAPANSQAVPVASAEAMPAAAP